MSDTTAARRRFPNRTAGTVTEVSRGQQRRKPQSRDLGEKVTVTSPQVSSPPRKSVAKKHPPTDGRG